MNKTLCCVLVLLLAVGCQPAHISGHQKSHSEQEQHPFVQQQDLYNAVEAKFAAEQNQQNQQAQQISSGEQSQIAEAKEAHAESKMRMKSYGGAYGGRPYGGGYQKPIYVNQPVYVPKPIYVPKPVYVPKPIYVNQKPTYVNHPVYVPKPIYQNYPYVVHKPVYYNRPVVIPVPQAQLVPVPLVVPVFKPCAAKATTAAPALMYYYKDNNKDKSAKVNKMLMQALNFNDNVEAKNNQPHYPHSFEKV